MVDDGDPVGELVGLVQVLRAKKDRRPAGGEGADDVPHLVARAWIESGRRLVEEQQLRGDDDAPRITDMVFLVLVIAVAVVVWLFVALFSWQFARLLAITEVDVFVVMPDQPALEHPSRGGRSRYLP